jgi:alanyl-tRNA synthetase
LVSPHPLVLLDLIFPLKGIGNIDATVKAIYHKKTFFQSTSDIPPDMVFGILLDRTSFYAEAGGQEYDTGNIVIDGIADFEVTNVQVFNGYVLHIGHLKYGQLSVDDNVVSSYDEVSLRYPNAHLINCELLDSTLAASQQSHGHAHSKFRSTRDPR